MDLLSPKDFSIGLKGGRDIVLFLKKSFDPGSPPQTFLSGLSPGVFFMQCKYVQCSVFKNQVFTHYIHVRILGWNPGSLTWGLEGWSACLHATLSGAFYTESHPQHYNSVPFWTLIVPRYLTIWGVRTHVQVQVIVNWTQPLNTYHYSSQSNQCLN